MTRYFFNLYNDHVLLDEEGVELADLDAALEWARREACYMAAESVKVHAHLILSHKIVVSDAIGDVGTVTFGDVIRVS